MPDKNYVKLVDMVNVSDFIDLSNLLQIYEKDQVEHCYEYLKKDRVII
jgi:hypothetical protein